MHDPASSSTISRGSTRAPLSVLVLVVCAAGGCDAVATECREGSRAGSAVARLAPVEGSECVWLAEPARSGIRLAAAQPTPARAHLDVPGRIEAGALVMEVAAPDFELLEVGDSIRVEPTRGGHPLGARVVSIGAVVDPLEPRASVLAALEGDASQVPDQPVRAICDVGVEQGVLVPAQALLLKEGAKLVYVAVEAGGYAARRVTVGYRLVDQVQIASGLQAGESVVIAGALGIDRFVEQVQ